MYVFSFIVIQGQEQHNQTNHTLWTTIDKGMSKIQKCQINISFNWAKIITLILAIMSKILLIDGANRCVSEAAELRPEAAEDGRRAITSSALQQKSQELHCIIYLKLW